MAVRDGVAVGAGATLSDSFGGGDGVAAGAGEALSDSLAEGVGVDESFGVALADSPAMAGVCVSGGVVLTGVGSALTMACVFVASGVDDITVTASAASPHAANASMIRQNAANSTFFINAPL